MVRETHGLVGHLYELAAAERGDEGRSKSAGAQARGALAILRRGRGKGTGKVADSYPHVVPYLERADGRTLSMWEEQCYFLVAALFAGHRESRDKPPPDKEMNLGASFRAFVNAKPPQDQGDAEASVGRRFAALLDATPETLPDHLRYAVNLLNDTAIDWDKLLRDLPRWEYREVQLQWAKSFWRRSPRTEEPPADGTDGTDGSDENSDVPAFGSPPD